MRTSRGFRYDNIRSCPKDTREEKPSAVTSSMAESPKALCAQRSSSPSASFMACMPFPGRKPLKRLKETFFAKPRWETSTTKSSWSLRQEDIPSRKWLKMMDIELSEPRLSLAWDTVTKADTA